MLIQVNSNSGIRVQEDVARRIEGQVRDALSLYADRITRVEVHLSDENAHKGGDQDKRCLMEVRIEGMKPFAVSHLAGDLQLAIDGAAQKLNRAVGSELGRQQTRG